VLRRVIYAGTHHPSFEQGSQALRHLAGLEVSAKQVERLTQRIGKERCAEREAAVRAYVALPLPLRKGVPEGVAAPELAVVQVDGGRLQILDRGAAAQTESSGKPAAATSHWREDKVGLLATMTSGVAAEDPCPALPESFVDPLRIVKLAREIKGSTGVAEEEVATGERSATATEEAEPSPYTAPALAERSVVATRAEAQAFGEQLSQAAWARGFYGARRRAFVADGSSTNWGVWERHFSSFTPIVDFIHALTYVFQAAMAGRSFAVGWAAYREWIGQVWAGDIEPVIVALRQRQEELGLPEPEEAATGPRPRVAEALRYLENQRGRMRYAEYRKQGLPITSSHIESTIKRISQRVKGSEKFWSEGGAESILQLRADTLSETEPLAAFWKRREATATGQRRYSRAG
jgi:hypothetical protein